MEPQNLQELYSLGLKKMYTVEQKILDAMSNMDKAAANESLQQVFQEHREETSNHIRHLENMLGDCNKNVEAPGIAGLLKEAEEIVKMDIPSEVKDASLIGVAQAIEHVEIAAYGTLCTYAETLGNNEDLDQLKSSLSEEKNADSKLKELAKNIANQQASSE